MQLILFYLTGFLFLTGLGTLYRILFSIYHQQTFVSLTFFEKIHAIIWGLRFDTATASMFSILITLITVTGIRFTRKRSGYRYLFIPACIAIIAFQASDIMYFADTGRHVGYEIRDSLTDITGLAGTGMSRHPELFLFSIIAAFISSYALVKIQHRFVNFPAQKPSVRNLELPFLILIAFSVISIRGGLKNLPLEPLHAYKIGNSKQAVMALNGSYSSIYYIFRQKHAARRVALPPMQDSEVKQIMRTLYPGQGKELNTDFKKMNIVTILLESWPALYMQTYGFEKPVTPYFDRLRQSSLTATGLVANGHRTTEGIFATFCSFQNPLGQSVARSQLQNFPYKGLPELLRENGFSTAFFQGSNKDTSGTGAFAQRLGFSESYGKKDIKKRAYAKNYWGVQDPDLYNFILKKASEMKQPFLIGVNTNTTHDNKLPDGITAEFGMETDLDKKLSVLHFADQALGEFIGKFRNNPDFGPTMFVILADHTAGLEASNLYHYYIPFIVFSTDGTVPAVKIDRMVSQRDIAPTIVDLLGGSVPWFSGNSILDDTAVHFADYYHHGTLGWIEGENLIEIDITDNRSFSCYKWRDNFDLKTKTEETPEFSKLKKRALAFTNYCQDLLYSGGTLKFRELFSPER